MPTLCLTIQLPSVTRGMSLKVEFRRSWASAESPPARNLRKHAAGSCSHTNAQNFDAVA